MNGSSVQFRGIENIMLAYENCKIPAFAFLQGKGILHWYAGCDMDEGAAELEKFLELLSRGRSTAVYALQLYCKPGEDINNKTPYNNRFQCVLYEEEEYNGLKGSYARIRELEDKLAAKYEQEEEEEEKIGGLQGVIAGIIQKPEVQNFLLSMVAGVVRKFMGVPEQPASMAGVPDEGRDTDANEDVEGKAYAALSEEQQQLLTRAMTILMQGDPMIGTNLFKIATLLKNDPGKYKMFAEML